MHLEEHDVGNDEDQGSDDPNRIEGVMEEFMVHLARAVKDAQADEKCCYHCSSPEHFITIVHFEGKETVKLQGGDGINEGSPDPSDNNQCIEEPPSEGS